MKSVRCIQEDDSDEPELPKKPTFKRVKRACDQCRLRKLKCDAQHSCRNCKVRGQKCTYLHKSRRSRLSYLDDLEPKLARLKALFKTLWPSTDIEELLDDENSEARLDQFAQQVISARRGAEEVSNAVRGDHHIMLDTMFEEFPVLDPPGSSLRKSCSRLTLLSIIRDRCSQLLDESLQNILQQMDLQQVFGWDRLLSPSTPRMKSTVLFSPDRLPTRTHARNLILSATENACALVALVSRPSCEDISDRIYETPKNGAKPIERAELGLIYAVFALGALFTSSSPKESDSYFHMARGLTDLASCESLGSLQAIIVMALYLQSKFLVSSCRQFVDAGVAALRRIRGPRPLGDKSRNLLEKESLRRAFWTLWTLDVHLSLMLGFPRLLDWNIEDEGLSTSPDYESALPMVSADRGIAETQIFLPAAEAHVELTMIQADILKCIYKLDHVAITTTISSFGSFQVDYQKVLQIEHGLAAWYSKVSQHGFLGCATEQSRRTALLMSIAHTRVQMSLYLPFLHHILRANDNIHLHAPSHACAIACIDAAMHEISLVKDLYLQNLLSGPYWFLPSVTLTAIMTLLMGIVANPGDPKSKERLTRASEGTILLAVMTKSSEAFQKCLNILSYVIKHIQLGPQDPPASSTQMHDIFRQPPELPPSSLPMTLPQDNPLPAENNIVCDPQMSLMQLPGYMDANSPSAFPYGASAASATSNVVGMMQLQSYMSLNGFPVFPYAASAASNFFDVNSNACDIDVSSCL